MAQSFTEGEHILGKPNSRSNGSSPSWRSVYLVCKIDRRSFFEPSGKSTPATTSHCTWWRDANCHKSVAYFRQNRSMPCQVSRRIFPLELDGGIMGKEKSGDRLLKKLAVRCLGVVNCRANGGGGFLAIWGLTVSQGQIKPV